MEEAWIPARGNTHHGGPRHCEKDVTYSALTPVSPPTTDPATEEVKDTPRNDGKPAQPNPRPGHGGGQGHTPQWREASPALPQTLWWRRSLRTRPAPTGSQPSLPTDPATEEVKDTPRNDGPAQPTHSPGHGGGQGHTPQWRALYWKGKRNNLDPQSCIMLSILANSKTCY